MLVSLKNGCIFAQNRQHERVYNYREGDQYPGYLKI
jgi:hypothetical protein